MQLNQTSAGRKVRLMFTAHCKVRSPPHSLLFMKQGGEREREYEQQAVDGEEIEGVWEEVHEIFFSDPFVVFSNKGNRRKNEQAFANEC